MRVSIDQRFSHSYAFFAVPSARSTLMRGMYREYPIVCERGKTEDRRD